MTRDHSRVNWEEFIRCQVSANEAYSEAKHLFSVRNRDVLMNNRTPKHLFRVDHQLISGGIP